MATKRFEDSQVFIWDEDDQGDTICAWHERDKDPSGSHGICQACAHALKMQHKARRQAVKSLFQKGK